MGTMKSFNQLKEDLKQTKLPTLRDRYVEGKIFAIGESVQTADGQIAQIIDRGPNYVTLIKEGKTFKKWLNDIRQINEEAGIPRTQIYKEQLCFKGYKTKNFTKDLAEQFKQLTKCSEDQFAVINFIRAIDFLKSDVDLTENFTQYKTEFDRAIKYSSKFDVDLTGILSPIEDQLLEHSILEGLNFSAADKMKVAKIIASAADVVDHSGKHHEIVNRAAQQFKQGRHTPEGWKLMGAMLNKATEAGIQWDKNIFHKSIHKAMGLK